MLHSYIQFFVLLGNLLVQYKTRKTETHTDEVRKAFAAGGENIVQCVARVRRERYVIVEEVHVRHRVLHRFQPPDAAFCAGHHFFKTLCVRSIQRIDWALDLMLTHVTQGEVERRHCSDRFGSVRSSVFCIKELISEFIFYIPSTLYSKSLLILCQVCKFLGSKFTCRALFIIF